MSNLNHEKIAGMIKYCEEKLLVQGPLEYFMYINPLEHFEDTNFHKVMRNLKDLYGADGYQKEFKFIQAYREKRITPENLTSGIKKFETQDYIQLGHVRLAKYDVMYSLLVNPPTDENRHSVLKKLKEEENDHVAIFNYLHTYVESFLNGKNELWENHRASFREYFLYDFSIDIDDDINPFLVRFFSSYFDSGIAYWKMERRESGLLNCFIDYYSLISPFSEGWKKSLRKELRAIRKEQKSPEDIIERCLDLLGIKTSDGNDYIFNSALRLKGWMGLSIALERSPHLNKVKEIVPNFKEMLAIKLLVETMVVTSFAKDYKVNLKAALVATKAESHRKIDFVENVTYKTFHVLKSQGIDFDDLKNAGHSDVEKLVSWAAKYDNIERRKVWQQAYEYNLQERFLNAINYNFTKYSHTKQKRTKPSFQVLTCIDEREESFRRHIEEVEPTAETFAVPGHFGFVMFFKGPNDVHYRPLGPAGVVPGKYVEEVIETGPSRKFAATIYGKVRRFTFFALKDVFWGTFVALLAGIVTSLPFFIKIFYPGAASKFETWLKKSILHTENGKIIFETQTNDPKKYNTDEMVNAVYNIFTMSGFTSGFSDFIFAFGHGADTVNNPYAAAYNCGACGGGQGRPNARLFAEVANRKDIRARLKAKGLDIPDTTFVIGGYHDTCSDAVIYYDEDKLPMHLQERLQVIKNKILLARQNNAKERVRRFNFVPLDVSPQEALKIVEARANTLSEVIQEYDHASNAMCVIGGRYLTRGLNLDRRSFLISYDPDQDPNGDTLEKYSKTLVPVCAGINLMYYFSSVDNHFFGAGSKLPHNVVGKIGVVNGFSSDLQVGLYKQALGIHEPMRILFLIEAELDLVKSVIDRSPVFKNLVTNFWIKLSVISPSTGKIYYFTLKDFVEDKREACVLPHYNNSLEHFKNRRDNLEFSFILSNGVHRV